MNVCLKSLTYLDLVALNFESPFYCLRVKLIYVCEWFLDSYFFLLLRLQTISIFVSFFRCLVIHLVASYAQYHLFFSTSSYSFEQNWTISHHLHLELLTISCFHARKLIGPLVYIDINLLLIKIKFCWWEKT